MSNNLLNFVFLQPNESINNLPDGTIIFQKSEGDSPIFFISVKWNNQIYKLGLENVSNLNLIDIINSNVNYKLLTKEEYKKLLNPGLIITDWNDQTSDATIEVTNIQS